MHTMQNGRKKSDAEIRRQIERTRAIYADIGQALAPDMVVELYRYLGAAMNMASSAAEGRQGGSTEGKRSLKS